MHLHFYQPVQFFQRKCMILHLKWNLTILKFTDEIVNFPRLLSEQQQRIDKEQMNADHEEIFILRSYFYVYHFLFNKIFSQKFFKLNGELCSNNNNNNNNTK